MKHLAEKIQRIMTAFDRSHYDYMMFKEYGIPDLSKLSQEERYVYETEEQEKEESLIYIAKKLLPLVQAYIEAKHPSPKLLQYFSCRNYTVLRDKKRNTIRYRRDGERADACFQKIFGCFR